MTATTLALEAPKSYLDEVAAGNITNHPNCVYDHCHRIEKLARAALLEAEAMQPPTQRAQPAAESFIGQAEQADFEDDTWTFKMQHPYIVGAGFYRISYVGLTTPEAAA